MKFAEEKGMVGRGPGDELVAAAAAVAVAEAGEVQTPAPLPTLVA
jgi:hypothetical protein